MNEKQSPKIIKREQKNKHVYRELSVDGALATGAELAKQMWIITNFIQKNGKLSLPSNN